MGEKADQLAQEMSRFEEEILGTSPMNRKPLFSNSGPPGIQRRGPPGPPPHPHSGPPPGPPHPGLRGPPPGPHPGLRGPPHPHPGPPPGRGPFPGPPAGPPQGLRGPPPGPPGPPQGLRGPPPGPPFQGLMGPPPGPPHGFRGPPPGPPPRPPPGRPPPSHHLGPPSMLTSQLMPQSQPAPVPVMMPIPVQAPAHQVGAEASGAVRKSKKPLKSMKMKRDPKKLRMGGGKVWEDHSLDDWDQDDFRIFVGDLGNDVNDDTLARSFSRYPTFLKAKVIRDKYTKKTKGYGFVSFKNPQDFMQAMRDMNGKYIGNRPVKLRKSTWKDCAYTMVKKKEKEKKRLGFR